MRYQAADLPLHMRRHRRRYREHTRPYLHRTLCPSVPAPLIPGEEAAPRHEQRIGWMWAHALELLRELAPHAPRMTAPARVRGVHVADYATLAAAAGRFEPRIEIELRPGALATNAPLVTGALVRAGYRVERTREAGAPVLDAEREFLVCVRERRSASPCTEAPGLSHSELVASFDELLRARWFRYAPPEWLAPPPDVNENETEPE